MPLLIIPVLIVFIWAAPRFFKWLLLFSVMAGGAFFCWFDRALYGLWC